MKEQDENKKKKKKFLLIMIPVLLLSAAAIVLGVKGRDWFGPADEPTESQAASGSETEPEQSTEEEPPIAEKESAVYWNVERALYAYKSEGGLSSRTLDKDDQTYHILFASEGRQMTRRTKDKNIVNQIDNCDVMGLIFDEDGLIVGVIPIEECTGGYQFRDFFVEGQEGTVVTLNSSDSFMGEQLEFDTTCGARIFDVSGAATFVGIELFKPEFKAGEKLSGILDKDGKLVTVLRTYSMVHTDMYWNVERMWDSGNGVSSRMPDKDGVYTFLLAVNGGQVTVKTKSRSVANEMDGVAAKSFGLTFDEEGYAITCIKPTEVTHGQSIGSWYDIMQLDGLNFHAKKTIQASDTGREIDGTIAKDCEIYDVSGMGKFVGEITTVRQYDRMQGYTGPDGQVHVLYVVARKISAPIYWNVSRKYDSNTKQTTRVKEADGYYHIKACCDGKVYDLKTTSKELATKVDQMAARTLGIIQQNGIIQEVYDGSNIYSSKGSWYDVTQIYSDGSIHVKKTIQATDTGNQYDIEIAPDCKVFNVTETYTNNIGERTTLRVGDRIQGWTDLDGKAKIIFVVNRDAKNPVTAHKTAHVCEECGQSVTWTAWTSGSSLPTETGHYYLTGNVACAQQSIPADQHVVLCMNGYNIRCTGKRLYATFESGATLSLHDCTGKSKMFSSFEGDLGTTQGGLLWVRYGSVKIYGGTYDISNQVMPNTGGLIDVSAGTSLEIYGGTFIGTETLQTGGIINVRAAGTLKIAGGTFTAGKAADHKGDGIFIDKAASVTLSGTPKMTGGTTQIYLAEGVKLKLDGLKSGASLGITMEKPGAFTSNYESGAEKYFKSDDKSLAVGVVDGALALGTSAVTKVTLNATTLEMLKNAEEQMTVELEPEGALSKITWTSSDESVATVDENGLIVAKGDGTATITAKTENGQTAACTVTVAGEAIRATGVSFESATAEVLTGATSELKVNVLPENTTVKTVTYTSSDETVATVDENGVVTGLKEGTAVITAATKDGGFTANCTVTVKAHTHCLCGGECADPAHTCANVQWIPWTSTSTLPKDAADHNKYYYLTDDVTLGGQQMIAANTDIYLCLNGHTVTLVGNERLISTFNTGSSLTITDCSEGKTGTMKSSQQVSSKTQQGNIVWVRYGAFSMYAGTLDATGVVTGGNGAAVNVPAGTTFNFYGGTIKGGQSTVTGGAVHVDGTMNMYGGTIEDGRAKYGGNVGMNNANAVFNMKGGTITGGKSVANSGGGQGGNIAITSGTFNFSDGLIEKGSATGNQGGNVSMASASSILNMTGGRITGGTSSTAASGNVGAFYQASNAFRMSGGTIDGLVYIATGWATISGKAVITGGTTNLTLNSGIKIAVSNLQDGANIGLTMNTPGVFAASTNTDFMKYFTSDKAQYAVIMTSSGMALGQDATAVSLDKSAATLGAGETLQLTATTEPAGLNTLSWTSSDSSVATVSATGLVTAVADGEATITVEISGLKATCLVTVHTNVTSVSVTLASMMVGNTAQASVTVLPENASDKSVTYSIEDTTIATVDASGLVTGVAIGTTTLEVTSVDDPTKKATATVTVTEFVVPAESISLDRTTAELKAEDTLTLIATVLPEAATHKEVTWASSDETVATVENGVVTPLKSGTVTITATVTSDTSKTASCTVTVKAHEHCVCGGTTALNGHATHASQTWTAWSTANALPSESGYYYLTTDVTYDGAQWSQPANTEIRICLNGHTITRKQAARVLSAFNSGSKLTLTDCAATPGTVKVAAGTNSGVQGAGVWVRGGASFDMYRITVDASGFIADNSYGTALCIEGNATANIYSGTLKGGSAKYGGTAHIAANGTLNLYGGLITGGRSVKHATNGGGQGGNVNIIGTFNMYGGEIRDGYASGNAGGNVAAMISTSKFNMTGGLITGGLSTTKNAGNVNISYQAPNGGFKMSGGQIDGEVMIGAGTQEISGTANISKGQGKNLYLTNGIKIKVGSLQSGAKIALSMQTPGAFATDAPQGSAAYFTSDASGCTVTESSGTLSLSGAATHTDHCICGGRASGMLNHTCSNVTWTAWTSTSSLPTAAGNYYLTVDVTAWQATVEANATVNLCLNGHDIYTQTDYRAFGVNNAGGMLNICDCTAKTVDGVYHAGRLIATAGTQSAPLTGRQGLGIFLLGSGGNAAMYGGIIDCRFVCMTNNEGVAVSIGAGRTFSLYGGEIYGGTNTANGSAIYNNGTFNMYGGTVYGKQAQKGGAVYQNGGTFNMYGGEIYGGNASEGGSVRIHAGTFNLYDGTIQGGTATNGGNVFLNINTTFNMEGGTLTGGVANSGGNVYTNAANGYNGVTFNLKGGLITKGSATAGGNITLRTSGTCIAVLNMTGGTISQGKSTSAGSENILEGGTVNKTGGTIE